MSATLDSLLKLSGIAPQPFYGPEDATKILRVPYDSVKRLIRAKKLHAIVINRKHKLIPHGSLAAFVANASGNVISANDEHLA